MRDAPADPSEPRRPRRRRARTTAAAPAEPAVTPPPALRRYVAHLRRLRAGNHVRLLCGGREAYPAMLAAIAGARRQVHLESYILEDDRTGQRFADALIERARAGVAVRVIYDAVGGLGVDDDWLDALRAAGVAILEYHPIAPWRERFELSRRDHRKILVVDDELAFTGGLNVADDYAPIDDGGGGWHDLHCELRGPVVLDLARLFRRTWINEGGPPFAAPPRPEEAPPLPGGALARILDNGGRRRRQIQHAHVRAIDAAQQVVLLENAYFLPDRPVRRALARAVRRGVDVQVVVPGRSDVRAVEYAGLYAYRGLVRAGVQVLRWQGPMLHSKAAVVDGAWTTIGSYNFDARSLFHNLEVVAEVIDPGFGAVALAQLRQDAARSAPFDEATWTTLPWWKQALAWLAFRLRHWL